MNILTRKETADYLRISLRTLERLERAGKMPSRIQVSDRRFVYRKSDVIEYFLGKSPGRPELSFEGGYRHLVSDGAELD